MVCNCIEYKGSCDTHSLIVKDFSILCSHMDIVRVYLCMNIVDLITPSIIGRVSTTFGPTCTEAIKRTINIEKIVLI